MPTSARYLKDQTGWSRPSPLAICQEIEVLLAITEFNYDLHDPEFLQYFKNRTGQQLDSCDCGWDYVRKVLANPWKYPAQEFDIPTHWLITRGKLQDCWELYVTTC